MESLLISGGYLGMFAFFLFDGGPASIALGGVVAHSQYFNAALIFILTLVGNFIPDIVFYAIGYKGREAVEKYGNDFGITFKRMAAIEKFYKAHPFKTILVVKMIPFIPAAGLAAAGASRLPFGMYVAWCSTIIVITNAAFFATGYLLGEAYVQFAAYQALMIVIIAVALLFLWDIYPDISARIGEKIDPELGKIE